MNVNCITDTYETDYHGGWLVITDKASNSNHCVKLRNEKGRNITASQFNSSVASHGFERACQTFVKLAAK